MRRGILTGAALAVTSMAWWGCRTPTQITLTVTTTTPLVCKSIRGLVISVAATPQAAEDGVVSPVALVPERDCDEATNGFGTLVLTPGEMSTAAVVVVAGLRNAVSTCTRANGYAGCIVVRRSVSFIEHTKVTLPIEAEAACADVPCDVVTTCRAGTCVSSSYHCDDGDICQADDPRVLSDGGFDPDATHADGARPDAPPASVDATSDAMGDATTEAAADSGDPEDAGPLVNCTDTCLEDGALGLGPTCTGGPTSICCYSTTPAVHTCTSSAQCGAAYTTPIAACCTSSASCGFGNVCCLHTKGGVPMQARCESSCATGLVVCTNADVCADNRTCQPYKGTLLNACQ